MRFLKTSNLVLKSLTIAALLALAGCSAKQETSSVKMTFPDWDDVYRNAVANKSGLSSMSVPDQSKIKMISVNITAADMAPIIKEVYRRPDDNDANAPTTFDIGEVPRGSARLVQVLALYEGGGSTQFFYGDTFVEMNAAVVGADVFMTLANSTTIDSNTVGRYIGAGGVAPTGRFQYRFVPPNRPSMIVTTGEIFSGWMDVFSLQSPILKHTKLDGSPIFDLGSAAALFAPGTQSMAARIYMPAGYEDRGNEMESGPERQLNVGFFGPGAPGKRLCVNGNSSTINGYFDTASKNNQFKWSGKSGPVGGEELFTAFIQDPDSAASTFEKGGSGSASCATTGVEFVDFLRVDETRLGNSDNYMQFRGPFGRIPGVATPENGGMLTKEFNSGAQTATIRFSPLPGTVEALGGFKVFYRSMATAQAANEDDQSIRGNDGYRCGEFASMGFASVNATSPATSYPYIHEAVIPAISTELAASKLQIIVCPYAKASDGGGFFESGLQFHGPYSNGGGGGGGATPPAMATKLMIMSVEGASGFSPASRRYAGNAVCYPVDVIATDATGNPGLMAGPTTVSISRSDTFYTNTYSDKNCSNQVTQLTNFMARQRIYVRDTQSVDRDYEFTFTAGGGLSAGTYFARRMDTAGPTNVHMLLPPEIYAHSCVPFDFLAQETSQGAIKSFTGGAIGLNTLGGNLFYYAESDWNCSTPISTSVAFPNDGSAVVSLRLKYTGNDSNTNLDPTATNNGVSGTVVPATFVVRQPGAPAGLQLSIPNQLSEGACQPFAVQLVDSNGRATLNTTGSSIGFSVSTSGSGTFKYGCATNTSSPANAGIANMQSSYTSLSYIPGTAGTHGLTFSVTTGPASITGGTINLNVAQAVASRVLMVLPGQTWNGSMAVGAPIPVVANVPFSATLYALRPNGGVDPLFNLPHDSGAGFNLGSSYGPGFYVSSPPMWAGGVATISITPYGSGSATFMTGGANGLQFESSQPIQIDP